MNPFRCITSSYITKTYGNKFHIHELKYFYEVEYADILLLRYKLQSSLFYIRKQATGLNRKPSILKFLVLKVPKYFLLRRLGNVKRENNAQI